MNNNLPILNGSNNNNNNNNNGTTTTSNSNNNKKSRNDLSSLSIEDAPTLCQVLKSALSTNNEEQKNAENTLFQIEKRNGFPSLLLHIIQNKEIESPIRYLAAICFKNTIDKYWKILD
ncbi:hypothetical protein ABK040_016267 [Willaertia magna]